MNDKQFLEQKLKNFGAFLNKEFADQKAILMHLGQLATAPIDIVIAYIKKEITPYENDFSKFVSALCKQHSVDMDKIPEEVIQKINLYLSCFCEICKGL
jgi:uncharacterized membrane protein